MLHVDETGNKEAVCMSRETKIDRAEMRALATKCLSKASCLETGKCVDRDMCQIERAVGGNILFLKDDGFTFSCPYKVAFGFSHFCSCPVRAILFKEEKRMPASGCSCQSAT
jgi:hypothetical protein